MHGRGDVRDVVAHLVGCDDVPLYRSPREQLRALLRFATRYATALGGMAPVVRASGGEVLMALTGRSPAPDAPRSRPRAAS